MPAWKYVPAYLLSVHLQLAIQLAVSTLLAGLPTFVRALHYPHACFAPVLSTICLISMSPDGHLGTKARAAAALLGETWLGAAAAGAVVSAAKPLQASRPGTYVGVLCISSSVGIAVLAAPRAGPASLTLWPNITVSSLVFCVTVLYGQHTQGFAQLWAHDVGAVCLAGATAAAAVLLAASLVLPSAASEEVVRLAALAVRGAGHSMTHYVSLLLDTTEPTAKTAADAAGGSAPPAAAAAAPAGPADWQPEKGTAAAAAAGSTDSSYGSPAQLAGMHVKAAAPAVELQPVLGVQTTHLPAAAAAAAPAAGLAPAGSADQEQLQVVVHHPGSSMYSSSSSSSNVDATTAGSIMCDTTATTNATVTSNSSNSNSTGSAGDASGSSSEGFSSESNSINKHITPQQAHNATINKSQLWEDGLPAADAPAGLMNDEELSSNNCNTGAAHAGGHPLRRSSTASLLFEDALAGLSVGEARMHMAPVLPGRGGSSSSRQRTWLGSSSSRHPQGAGEGDELAADQIEKQLVGHSKHKRRGLRGLVLKHHHKEDDGQQHDKQQQQQQHHDRQHHHHHHHHRVGSSARLQQQQQRQARGPQALAVMARHGHGGVQRIHAVTLHTAAGPVTLLGPSVDELRPMLLRAQGCLSSAVAEPVWLNPWQAAAQRDLQGWAAVLAAAEQLVSMMSALQDVLVHEACPSPRLMSRDTALYPSAASFSQAAGAIICRAITSCADLSRALLLLLQPCAARPGAKPADTAAALQDAAAAFVAAAASWDDARRELLKARAAALEQYWGVVVSATHVRVARHGQVLSSMFVWVLLEGLLGAVQHMEAAGLDLLQAHAKPQHSSSRGKVAVSAVAAQQAVQPTKQQQQQGASAGKQRMAAAKELGKAVAMMPVLCNLAGLVGLAAAAVCRAATTCCAKAAGSRQHHQPAHHGKQQQQQQQAGLLSFLQVRAAAGAVAAGWVWLGCHRDAAAAFKFWLCLSLLMALVLLLSAGAGGGVHPSVVSGMQAVSTHGMIAFVLAWHERVESTVIRVLLRILGTYAGSSIGYAAVAIAPSSAPALMAMLCAFAFVLAPLASASLHLRFATALTFISASVVVLCQYDLAAGQAAADVGFYVGRIVQVTVACLWAGLSNKLLLPWSSGDWCREKLAAAYEAAAGLIADSCELQLQAYRHLHDAAAAAGTDESAAGVAADQQQLQQYGDVVMHIVDQQLVPFAHVQQQPAPSSSMPPATASSQLAPASQAEVQQQLQQLRSSLQSSVVAPLVAVQRAVDAEVSVWHHHAPRGLAAKSVKLLLRSMLELADHITGLQATLAALPETSVEQMMPQAGDRTVALGNGAPAAAAGRGDDVECSSFRAKQQPQQQQQQRMSAQQGDTDVHAAEVDQDAAGQQTPTSAAAEGESAGAAALRYLAGALMGPLHEALAAQMTVLQAAASAVKELLLLPHGHLIKHAAAAAAEVAARNSSRAEAVNQPKQQLQQALQQLQQQRHSSTELLVQLRQAIHHDMRQQQKQSRDQQQQQQQQGGDRGSRGGAAAAAVGGWWVHAGGHYMQALAFAYALDKAVQQMMAVAEVALQEGSERD